LEKILRWREINAALLDQLRARLVSESAAHQALYLVLRQGLLLRPGREGKDQPHRQQEKSQRFSESHCDLRSMAQAGTHPSSLAEENPAKNLALLFVAGKVQSEILRSAPLRSE
jgi:hypothetical protein